MSVNEKMKTKPFVVGISVIFAALVVVALVTGRVPWWALLAGAIGFGIAIAYQQGRRPFGRYSLLVLVAWVLILGVTACSSPNYTTGQAPGGTIPPTLIGARWAHTGEDMECGIGLTKDAVAGVVSVFAPPVGFVAWLAWGVTSGDGTRADLADCWNSSQQNWREFELMTQCWGQPVLTSTWTDRRAAAAWVKIPFCQCNATCIHESMMIRAGWAQVQNWCRQALNWFFCFGIGPNAAMTEGASTLPPDQSLTDAGLAPPAWDPLAPAPEHPMCPDGWPCGS